MSREEDSVVHAKIEGVLEELRPFFADDGGDVEFVEVTQDGIVKVRLVGACDGCPSSSSTMQQGIKIALQEVLPMVTDVQSI